MAMTEKEWKEILLTDEELESGYMDMIEDCSEKLFIPFPDALNIVRKLEDKLTDKPSVAANVKGFFGVIADKVTNTVSEYADASTSKARNYTARKKAQEKFDKILKQSPSGK